MVSGTIRRIDAGRRGRAVIELVDDFSAGELDRSRWNVFVTGPVFNDEQQAYVDSTETVYVDDAADHAGATGRGCLVLHPRFRPGTVTTGGTTFDFVSGRIDTRDRFEFRYGSLEARIRLPAGRGVWPAFWALGDRPWPGGGEIDVMEYVGEPDWVGSAVHGPGYSGEGGLVNQLHLPDDDPPAGRWHVFGADWTPDEITFRVDGRVSYRITRPMIEFHGRWAFDRPMHLLLNVALGGTYPYKINGITSPYHGLDAATVEAIRADEVYCVVDWVRVQAREARP